MPSVPNRTPLTPWQQFKLDYKYGCGSQLCERATRICLARGSVPAQVVLIGEGPGDAEDSLGSCFVGPAGNLLDRVLDNSIGVYNKKRAKKELPPLKWAFTNLVGCLPTYGSAYKAGQPEPEDIELCRPRLEAFIELCDPELVIAVGKLPASFLKQGFKKSIRLPDKDTPVLEITHPAWALRNNAMVIDSYERRTATVILAELYDLWGQ